MLSRFLRARSANARVVVHIPSFERCDPAVVRHLLDEVELNRNLALALCTDNTVFGVNLKREWLEVEAFHLTLLDAGELPDLLTRALGHHRLEDGFFASLDRAAEGWPVRVATRLRDLLWADAVVEDDESQWHLAKPAAAAEELSGDLFASIRESLERMPNHSAMLREFLLTAALCGPAIPAKLVLRACSCPEVLWDDLLDLIEDHFANGSDSALFVDLEGSHPSFPDYSTLRFRSELDRQVLLLSLDKDQRDYRAVGLLAFLRAELPMRTRGVIELFVSVASHFKEETDEDGDANRRGEIDRPHEEVARYLAYLSWWADKDSAEELAEELGAKVASGEMDAEDLWRALQDPKNQWTPLRRMALLDAYARIPAGIPPERLFGSHSLKADCLMKLGRYQAGLESSQEALALAESFEGPDSRNAQLARYLVGNFHWRLGAYSTAKTVFEELLKLETHVLGGEHPSTLAARHGLAQTLLKLGDFQAARDQFQDVLNIEGRTLGVEHPDTLITRHNLARTLLELGEYRTARALFEQVLEAFERVLGTEHMHTAKTREALTATIEAMEGKEARIP